MGNTNLVHEVVDSSFFNFKMEMFLFTAHAQDEGVLLLLRLSDQEGSVVGAVIAQQLIRIHTVDVGVEPAH